MNWYDVKASLDIAVDENGYQELVTMSPYEVAVDLCDFDKTFENEDVASVVHHVERWQKERMKR